MAKYIPFPLKLTTEQKHTFFVSLSLAEQERLSGEEFLIFSFSPKQLFEQTPLNISLTMQQIKIIQEAKKKEAGVQVIFDAEQLKAQATTDSKLYQALQQLSSEISKKTWEILSKLDEKV